MMNRGKWFLAALALFFSCTPETNPPEEDPEELPPYTRTVTTGLRSVFIYPSAPVSDRDTWVEQSGMAIYDDAGRLYYQTDNLSLKGRGNSSWLYPKKPYTLKLPGKTDLLGKGESKRYVLLANYMDRTRLRNDVSLEIARRSGLDWTPSGEFVELYLDGKHKGMYWLGEQIRVEGSRLHAEWLVEMETNAQENWSFRTNYGIEEKVMTGLPVSVKYPDEEDLTEASFSAVKSMVFQVENAIYEGGDYAALIDLDSWADWFLVHEVSGNPEPNEPRSCFFHAVGGRMYAGPVWDFDWNTYKPSYTPFVNGKALYFGELMNKPDFIAALKRRWAALKPQLSTLEAYIDARAEAIRLSDTYNAPMWRCMLNANGDDFLSFQEAVDRMKQGLRIHIEAVDEKVNAL